MDALVFHTHFCTILIFLAHCAKKEERGRFFCYQVTIESFVFGYIQAMSRVIFHLMLISCLTCRTLGGLKGVRVGVCEDRRHLPHLDINENLRSVQTTLELQSKSFNHIKINSFIGILRTNFKHLKKISININIYHWNAIQIILCSCNTISL